MCGIYGSTKYYSDNQIKEKLKRIEFRGPDFSSFVTRHLKNSSKIYLGHNRLAILDLDKRSNQPFNYLNKVIIVFNGEIYNFLDLKKELSSLGCQFKTTSDTEVICALYLEFGEGCIEKMSGMFSLVIYDIENNILFGARDRMGKKPFYYCHNGTEFEFSSQISSIAKYRKDLTISEKSIDYYLKWNAIPDPYSIYEEVFKLKPGHSFTFNLLTGDLDIKQYWDVTSFNNENNFKSYEESKDELHTIIEESVKQRMIADVPLGVFLSGGVDSSLITALAQKNSTEKIKSFSVKFNEEGFDESKYSAIVSNHLNTDHNIIECDYKEGIDLIKNFSHYYDEPFADSSAIPSMLLSKVTKKHVTVALSGDGGDESFLGYHRYNWMNQSRFLFEIPYQLRVIMGKILQLTPNYRMKIIGKVLQSRNINMAYLATITNTDNSFIKNKYDTILLDEIQMYLKSNKNLIERISDLDLVSYINWSINTKVDRATMSSSLEVRAPLMDNKVIEYAQKLPTDFKFGNGGKKILKDILYEYVPKEVFDRPKSGFTMPFKEWFRNDLKGYVLEELSDNNLKDLPGIDSDVVKKMISQHMNGEWNRTQIIWKLLVLKQWLNNN